MVTATLKDKLETKLLEVYLRAQEVFGRTFELPAIEWKDMGGTAADHKSAFVNFILAADGPAKLREAGKRLLALVKV